MQDATVVAGEKFSVYYTIRCMSPGYVLYMHLYAAVNATIFRKADAGYRD